MRGQKILIALGLLVLIPLMRFLWFYQGIYHRSQPIQTPAYDQLDITLPEINSATAIPPKSTPDNFVVLFDTDHENMFMLSEIETLTDELNNLGVQIEYSNFGKNLTDYLKFIKAYIVIAPTTSFTSVEIEEIVRFVERGGQLLIINDPTRSIYEAYNANTYLLGIDVANILLAPFDIVYQNDYVYNLVSNEGNFQNIYLADFADNHSITKNISQVVFYGAQSIKTSKTALIRGDNSTLSSLNDQGGDLVLAAFSKKGNGSILVLGDINFMSKSYYLVADNYLFISNIAKYLISGTRQPGLEDIPYIFERPVTILTEPDSPIDNDLLETLTKTQNFLKTHNLSLQLSDVPTNGNDLLILGTFPPDDQLGQYLEPFDLVFNINQSSDFNSDNSFEFSNDEIEPEEESDSPDSMETAPTKDTALTPESTAAVTSTPRAPLYMEGTDVIDETATATPEDIDNLKPTPTSTIINNDYLSNDNEDTVYVPHLGEFSAKGIGLILFTAQNERNTLILMTASTRSLGDFTYNILNYGDLSSCLIKENTAVCNIDSNYADYEESNNDNGDDNNESTSEFDIFDDSEFDDGY